MSITAGQTTVTGAGTNFALNARVGDAFQGPDGRWYEVANIASATVMGILPAYQGSTVAAGTYGLAPMQGYVKESADRLLQVVDQWGSTLASLGAVATENVVPVSKGGTGAINQADARMNLGLANAAAPFSGASSVSAGTPGLVPAPSAGDQLKFLTGGGAYAAPPATSWGQIAGALEDQSDIQAVLTAQNSKIASLESLRPVAMLTFDGASATPAIISQKGIKVASISRVATGVHRLTFSSNIASATNKILVLTCPVRTTSTFLSNFWFDASSPSSIDINTFTYSGGVNTNISPIPIIIYELP
ncbi:hypothetical protein P0Y43_09755 [Pseudomonas entomophila]|uniref:hypothetical protein n=1 Tax=Pseudomonas entomophila TaxID=312306 RepID=UPI0023D7B8BE|nr:hypothetical protein [Pseudomonas entomophila]MDF0731007.1 hypothetical protein [Pseudomonas entomophila]